MTFFYTFERLPFDWQTPFGYSLATSFVFASFFCLAANIASTACFVIGIYWWIKFFIAEIIQNLKNLNKLESEEDPNNFEGMKKLFCLIIQDFSEMKELSP